MDNNILDSFSKLGLKRDEAKVYLECLGDKENGLFVHEIVKRSGIKRSTVDIIIRRLLKKKFLSGKSKGLRKQYVSAPPNELLFAFQRNLVKFRKIVPELMSLDKSHLEASVTYYEGRSGIKAVYDEIILALRGLPKKERINYVITSGIDIETIYPNFEHEHIARRWREGISVRLLTPKGCSFAVGAPSRKKVREVKTYDKKEFPFEIELSLANDKTMLVSNFQPMCGVVIHSKIVTDSLRSIFNMLWDYLGKPEPVKEGA